MICRGVLNIVHGTNDTVNRICDHPDIKAISFVGSDGAGRYIYERGGKHGKRVQVLMSIEAFCLSPFGKWYLVRTSTAWLLHALMASLTLSGLDRGACRGHSQIPVSPKGKTAVAWCGAASVVLNFWR